MNANPCEHCGGYGNDSFGGLPITCPYCKGTGHQDTEIQGAKSRYQPFCPMCHGSGKSPNPCKDELCRKEHDYKNEHKSPIQQEKPIKIRNYAFECANGIHEFEDLGDEVACKHCAIEPDAVPEPTQELEKFVPRQQLYDILMNFLYVDSDEEALYKYFCAVDNLISHRVKQQLKQLLPMSCYHDDDKIEAKLKELERED